MFDVVIWGTVAQWVSALLSGASVLLALSIIIRDRRQAQRKQARRIVVGVHPMNKREYRFTMLNGSDEIILRPALTVFGVARDERSKSNRARYLGPKDLVRKSVARDDWSFQGTDGKTPDVLHPLERVERAINVGQYADQPSQPEPIDYWVVVHFTDVEGREWLENPYTNRKELGSTNPWSMISRRRRR